MTIKTVNKHISEVEVGDQILYDGNVFTATSDAYTTKETGNCREWNVEVESEERPENYLYASYFADGIVMVVDNA